MTFNLRCEETILSFIDAEAKEEGCSRTEYINRVLATLFAISNPLTSGTRLQELEACSRLLNDDVMREIPEIAKRHRRHIDQMLLWLVDMGISTLKYNSAVTVLGESRLDQSERAARRASFLK
jgi:hypothetical protein